MNKILALAVVVACSLNAVPARADDEPGLLDGGGIVGGVAGGFDGGSAALASLQTAVRSWTMVIRCEGAQSTRYKLCTSATCVPNAHNQLLDYDVSQYIDVSRTHQSGVVPASKTHIGLKTDDGGTPYCVVGVVK